MVATLRRLTLMLLVAIASVGVAATAVPDEVRPAQVPKGSPAKKKVRNGKKGVRPTPADGPAAAAPASGDGAGLKFSRDIAPILIANCTGCHKAGHRSGFDQTSFETLIKGGKSGPEIVAGDPEASRLVLRIKGEETPKMPPGQRQLSDATIARVERWIKEGARLDAGPSPSDPLAKYAATPEDLRRAELAKLSPEERDRRTEAAARDRLKKADPRSRPEMTASPHFLLFAEMPKDRAVALLKTIETQLVRLNRLLGAGGGKGLASVEKVGLYVFKGRTGFTEFARTIENQDIEAGEEARGKLNVESPYLVALDPLAGGPETTATASKKGGRSRKDDAPSGPERSLAGLLTEQLAVGALNAAGKPPRWLTSGLSAYLASGVEPRSPYYRRLRAIASEQFREGWQTKATEALGDQTKPETVRAVGFAMVEWLANVNAAALPEFVRGMLRGGEKLDETIAGCLGGSREEFLIASGAWVEQNYAGRR